MALLKVICWAHKNPFPTWQISGYDTELTCVFNESYHFALL